MTDSSAVPDYVPEAHETCTRPIPSPGVPGLHAPTPLATALILGTARDAATQLAPACRSLLWLCPCGHCDHVATAPTASDRFRRQCMTPPMCWPAGSFDLIVLEEPLKDLSAVELGQVAALVMSSLRIRGRVLTRLQAPDPDRLRQCTQINAALAEAWPLHPTSQQVHGSTLVQGWGRVPVHAEAGTASATVLQRRPGRQARATCAAGLEAYRRGSTRFELEHDGPGR